MLPALEFNNSVGFTETGKSASGRCDIQSFLCWLNKLH